jgi:hypothetical protein
MEGLSAHQSGRRGLFWVAELNETLKFDLIQVAAAPSEAPRGTSRP